MDPGLGKIRIRDEHPRFYFRELSTIFRLNILKFFAADPDSGSGIWDGKIQVREKHCS
jgi:hypothetical protein